MLQNFMRKYWVIIKAFWVAFLVFGFIFLPYVNSNFPRWFDGTWTLVMVLWIIRAEKRGKELIVRIHPGIQFILAAVIILSVMLDLDRWPRVLGWPDILLALLHRGPFALFVVLLYKDGFVWAWSSLKSALSRQRA